MRRFHSYGPVDCRSHFCVGRGALVQHCMEQLVGGPEEEGRFFTIWAPRQCGKTWLMRQVAEKIEQERPGRFTVGMMSMQGVVIEKDDPPETFLSRAPLLMSRFFNIDVAAPESWEAFGALFSTRMKLFERPLILFIDEFDKLPPLVIDRCVGMFRDMYLDRRNFCLHGLALIGVRAALGVDSDRGSPFNVQRSLHVPNFTEGETEDLFRQYQAESGQKIEPGVVDAVHASTRGQPGLVCWFGELLTEKFNPGIEKTIGFSIWEDVYRSALFKEWNNTVLNLVKKARGKYQNRIVDLFSQSDLPFSIDSEWCAYAYLNGIIDSETVVEPSGKKTEVCRFASPFIQQRLFNALTMDLIGERLPILALDPLDDLSDVFGKPELDVPALLDRYKNYLKRLRAKGMNPWKDQPRRADLRYTEYVGHFHLYFWLRQAVEDWCVVSPEFPAGNGRVDLHLKCGEKQAIIEVKSFTSMTRLKTAGEQAARYARKLNFSGITLVVFVPIEDEETLAKLSGVRTVEGVRLTVVAVGWA